MIALRSPRETLGGYVILPRLIDKVRMAARGELPPEYQKHLLAPPNALDGRFLEFTGLDPESLRRAILNADTDAEVLAWVRNNGLPRTEDEKRAWIASINAYRPDPEYADVRRKNYKEIAAKVDPATLNVFDLIDMDEGRIPL